jgi:hypothetical protein
MTLTPPSLIVASDPIDGEDSLEFFSRLVAANVGLSASVILLGPAGSSAQPFVYQPRRSGFEIRYLDGNRTVRTAFISTAQGESPYTLRRVDKARLSHEVAILLHGQSGDSGEPSEAATKSFLDVGFTEALTVGSSKYIVQTDVVEARPVVVMSSVFSGGRVVRAERHCLEEAPTLADVQQRVEAIHRSMLDRLSAGDLQ